MNIKEILRDEVYLGHLFQGKRTNVAYKQVRKERNARRMNGACSETPTSP